MKFKEIVQHQFALAGWHEHRNALDNYDLNKIAEYPSFIKDFFKEYGNLVVEDCNIYKSEVINELRIIPLYSFFEEEEAFENVEKIIQSKLYPIASFDPDNYTIACDKYGKVYMVGDYIFFRADNFKEGIEKVLLDDWSGSLQLNEDTGKWGS